MNYDLLMILAIVIVYSISKLIAAKMIASKKITDSKAKSIAQMFTFDPFSSLDKK